MEEVGQNYSEAANRVKKERMKLQEIIDSLSKRPMKCNHLFMRFSQRCAHCSGAHAYAHLANVTSSCHVWYDIRPLSPSCYRNYS